MEIRDSDDPGKLSETEKTDLIRELHAQLKETQARLDRLQDLQQIFRLWVRLKQKLFPMECGGMEIRDIDLDMLDADVHGVVSTFLSCGELTPKQRDTLYYCDECLNPVVLELQGFAGWYFRQLKALTSGIIAFQQKWP